MEHELRGQTGRRRRERGGDPSGCHATQMTPVVSKPTDVTRAITPDAMYETIFHNMRIGLKADTDKTREAAVLFV